MLDPRFIHMLKLNNGRPMGWQAPPKVVVKELTSIWLDPEDPEWTYAWDKAVPGQDKLEEHIYGEVWQYLGTWKLDGRWVHTFRHRMHPKTNQRIVRNVPVSPDFNPYNHQEYLA